MAHAHDAHGSHAHAAAGAADPAARRRALIVALTLTASYTAVEVVAGILTGSLALLADAGHMLSDNVSLGLALVAVWLAGKPATPQRSFGFKRAEVLAALANGAGLVGVSIWIFVEAARRLREPPEVLGGWMLVVAGIGLLVNVAAALVLLGPRRGNLNMEAAFRHVLGDMAGSVGALAAAAVILTTGWFYADPLASVLIGLLILGSAWAVLRESVQILLEGAPAGLDMAELEARLRAVPGVVDLHDLHAWTITSGVPALSAHLIVERQADGECCRCAAAELLRDEFGIDHSTLQLETEGGEPVCTLIACGRSGEPPGAAGGARPTGSDGPPPAADSTPPPDGPSSGSATDLA
jgi:cobalt-zinc-cadmium efflux system protein